jgi:50S ribosomal subunit-associated GTPase HflX
LDFGKIPRLVVFNKSDLVDPGTMAAIIRTASAGGQRDCIAVSALYPATIPPMLERAGALLARDLGLLDGEQYAPENEELITAKSNSPF